MNEIFELTSTIMWLIRLLKYLFIGITVGDSVITGSIYFKGKLRSSGSTFTCYQKIRTKFNAFASLLNMWTNRHWADLGSGTLFQIPECTVQGCAPSLSMGIVPLTSRRSVLWPAGSGVVKRRRAGKIQDSKKRATWGPSSALTLQISTRGEHWCLLSDLEGRRTSEHSCMQAK